VFVASPAALAREASESSPVPPARILYLNDCKPNGCRIQPGFDDDSRRDRSSIIDEPKTLTKYSGLPESWDRIVECVEENFAPFTIRVVTEDPGDVPHFEVFVAGTGRELGFPDAGGVASFTCGVIPDAVSFAFANLAANRWTWVCAVISQEAAHNFGLSHEMLATDAMTYIPMPSRKRFVDQTACVGTQGCCQPDWECACGNVEQNSFQRLRAVFGEPGRTPPDIFVDEPAEGAREELVAGFPVEARVEDWEGVEQVELFIDDEAVEIQTYAPWEFRTPYDLPAGPHRISLRAIDKVGFSSQLDFDVDVIARCAGDDECKAIAPYYVCGQQGRCVAGAVDDDGGCRSGGPSAPAGLAPLVMLAPLALVRRRGRRLS
jgi:hypothetical protein